MKKILVVGSGFSVKEWFVKNKEKLILFDEIHAINHSCMVIDGPFYHHISTDFKLNKEVTIEQFKKNDNLKIKTICCEHKKTPLWIKLENNGGTMFFAVCCHVFNTNKFDCKIYCIGCDFDYSGSSTHFYGKGGKDPLRAGESALKIGLDILNKFGIFYNLSDNQNSFLPFEKIDVSDI